MAVMLLFSLSLWSEEETIGSKCTELIPGVYYTQTMKISEQKTDFITNRIDVPENVLGVWFAISNAPIDLDLYVKHGEEIHDYDDVDGVGTSADFNEKIFLSRFSDTPLKTGIHYIDVAYQRKDIPIIDGKRVSSVPFTLKVEFVKDEVARVLRPGEPVEAKLLPEEGMLKTFTIQVPPNTPALRIDLYNTVNDLDLMVKLNKFAHSWEDADYKAESFLSREHIVLPDRNGQGLLNFGTYFITVIDQLSNNGPARFSLIADFSSSPPPFLMEIPDVPKGETPLDTVLGATVEISGKGGTGSGCLVTPDGLLLTNWHVIRDNSDLPSKDLAVACTLSPNLPPTELFRAEVIRYDRERDLALLRITGGFYQQTLPEKYSFPYFPLGDPEAVKIGDELRLIGFPGIGGSGSRASVTLTRGIVSGFEETNFGRVIKTDGQMTQGNSGGAAVNSAFELIGLPTTIIEKNAGQIGFIHPLSLIPPAWLSLIHERR